METVRGSDAAGWAVSADVVREAPQAATSHSMTSDAGQEPVRHGSSSPMYFRSSST